MKLIGIYCFRHIESGMCYVGQSVDIKDRQYRHFKLRDNSRIHNSIQKYGKDAFVFEVLELCSEDNLNAREMHWIAALDTVSPKGYNLDSGGKGGGRRSKESRDKIRNALTGIPHTPERRRKNSESQSGGKHHLYGEKRTEETKQKMRDAAKNNAWYRHDLRTPESIKEIHRLYDLGWTINRIRKKFNCSWRSIKQILTD